MARSLRADQRAVSITVNHVLAIAVTTVLVAGLVTSAGSLVADEQSAVTGEQLDAVGQQLSAEIESLDELAMDGATVTTRVDSLAAAASGAYSVTLLTADCPLRVEAPNCLRLSTGTQTVYVGVANQSPVSLDGPRRGTVTVTASGAGDGSAAPGVDALPRRVGVTEDVGETFLPREEVNLTNRLPIIDYMRFEPSKPVVGENVTLVANASDLDGEVASYRWDIDSDGNYSFTGERVTLTNPAAGRYPVTLQVVDEDGGARTRSKQLRVGGILYNNDSEALDRSDADDVTGGLGFSVSNAHGSEVAITHLYIDPEDDTISNLDQDGNSYEEVVVRSGVESVDVDLSDTTLYEGGRIVEFVDPANVSSSGDATVYLTEFQDAGGEVNMVGENVTIGMRYRTGDGVYTAEFQVSPDQSAGLTTVFDTDFDEWFQWDLEDYGFTDVAGESYWFDEEAVIDGKTGDAVGIVHTDDRNTSRFDEVSVSVSVREGGDAASEALRVEYEADDGTWTEVGRINASGVGGTTSSHEFTTTAAAALHDEFRLRIVQATGDDGVWYVDDVQITGRENS